MFVFTYGRGKRDICLYSKFEEECRIDVLFTHGRGMRDRYLYSHMEEECEIDVCIYIWKSYTG